MLNQLIVQCIGAIGYATLAFSYYRKEKRQILFMQIVAYIFFVVHYYLLDGITGSICNLIGLFSLVTIYIFEKRNLKNKTLVSMIFVLLLIGVNIVTFQNIYSIFPMVASVIVILSFLKDDENTIRWIGVVVAICWLIYAIVYSSYVAIAFEVITLINIFSAIAKSLICKKK